MIYKWLVQTAEKWYLYSLIIRWHLCLFVVRTLTFGLVLLITPFLPASNLFFRVGFVIAERVLYLSTAGYCLILAYAVAYCCYRWRKPKVGILACDISLFSFLISTLRPYFIVTNVAFSSGSWHHTVLFNVLFFFYVLIWSIPNSHLQKLLRAAMLVLLGVNVARCALRSQQWRSEQSLFTSALSVCPLNAKVRSFIHTPFSNIQSKSAVYCHQLWHMYFHLGLKKVKESGKNNRVWAIKPMTFSGSPPSFGRFIIMLAKTSLTEATRVLQSNTTGKLCGTCWETYFISAASKWGLS